MSPHFDVNVMMSELDALALCEIAPSVETAVVPNGVDIEYFSQVSETQDPSMIYTGGMNMFANRDAVMYFVNHIWPSVKAARPDARFDIVGQDPPQELLAKMSEDSGLRVHGYIDDVRPLVAKAAVYVVPIRVGGGTRLKVLDALAQGKPIVSTSIGCEGIRVTAGHNIELEDDPGAFARRVVALLNDPERRRELGGNARRLAESNYAWGPIGKRLEAVYEKAILRRKRREKTA